MKQSVFYKDGTQDDFKLKQKPGTIWHVPWGYKIYQLGEDIQLYGKLRDEASDGCPGIFVTDAWDTPDTKFTKEWQLFMYAANVKMRKNNVASLMGDTKFFMNGTGIGNDNEPRVNYILESDMDAPEFPRMDKYRMMVRGLYACRPYDARNLLLWTMNGNNPPLMKPGKRQPRNVQEVEFGLVTIDDYAYNPYTHLFAWHVCNNLKRKNGQINDSTISPFANGATYTWTPDPTQMYTFFPNVTNKARILVERRFMNEVVADFYPSPYRREVSL